MAGKSASGDRSAYWFWVILALPAVWLVVERGLHGKVAFVPLSGQISGWLLFATLMITPLMLLLGPLPWLKARRRNIGVAACLYGLLHLAFWMVNANLHELIRSFLRPSIALGWVAMAIMVALAWTSTDDWVARLGTGWKRLQRWVYPAAALTFGHWFLAGNRRLAVLSALPLILLSVWRIWRNRNRRMGSA